MKSPFSTSFITRLYFAGVLIAIAAFWPKVFASEPAVRKALPPAANEAVNKTEERVNQYREEPTKVNKAEADAAFVEIDTQLDELDRLADNAPSDEEKAAAKGRYTELKERRDQLKKDFNQARFDAFKSDVRGEWDKAKGWTRQKFNSRDDNARAASSNSAGSSSESKIALARLDLNLRLLESRVDIEKDTQRKAELNERVKVYKQRRDELQRDFDQARFEALEKEVRADWDKLS